MKVLRDAVRLAVKRPFTILFLGVVVLICNIINTYNPIFSVVSGLTTITRGDMSEQIIHTLQLLVNPDMLLPSVVLVLGISLVAAILIGLLFSGYLNVVNNGVLNKPKGKGEYAEGLRKHFVKVFLVSARVVFLGAILCIFILVASVPAIVITKAVAKSPQLFLASVFVDVLTAAVLFFIFTSFQMYMLFWYPSILNYPKKAFARTRSTVNMNFWRIFARLAAFEAVYILSYFVFRRVENPLIGFAGNWIFTTAYSFFYIAYIFSAFKFYNAKKAN